MTIRHGPILEIAKQIVERTVFWKKAKCLLSDCFIHICRIIHLLRRDDDFYSTLLHPRDTPTHISGFFPTNPHQKEARFPILSSQEMNNRMQNY